jgi:citrate lyase subunit beta/citryl-CoA lyase
MWPLRSMLFIPAHKIDWVRSVARFKPDSVVLDLEDAVPYHLKEGARAIAREGITLLQSLGIPAFVRINPWGEGGAEDVQAVATAGFSGVMLPKARDVGQIRELDIALAYAEGAQGLPLGSVAIMPLPETSEGLADARLLVAASRRCRTLLGIVGGPVEGDVARAMGFKPTLEGTEQLYLASKMVLDARAGGAPYPMASIIGTQLEDLDSVRMLVRRAKGLGFSGAVLIHPNHVAIANEVFSPSQAEIDYAAGLIEAMKQGEAQGHAAVRYHGIMIDYAMLPQAHALLREAERRGLRPSGAAA